MSSLTAAAESGSSNRVAIHLWSDSGLTTHFCLTIQVFFLLRNLCNLWSSSSLVPHCHQWQLNKTLLSRRVINPLRCLSIISGLGPKDVWHKGLRITIVEREPTRLDLHHDPVARQEHMIRCRQSPTIEERFISGDGFGCLETLAITAPKNVHRDRQLVASHVRLTGNFIRIEIDQFHYPIGIGSAGRGDQVGDWLSTNLHRRA